MDISALSSLLRNMLREHLPHPSVNINSVLPLPDLDHLISQSTNSFDFIYLAHHFQERFASNDSWRIDLDKSIKLYQHLRCVLLADEDMQSLRDEGFLFALEGSQGSGELAASVHNTSDQLLLPCLHRLGQSLGTRFVRYRTEQDLESAVTIYLSIISLTPSQSDRFDSLETICRLYNQHFILFHNASSLDTSLAIGKRAIDLLSGDDPRRIMAFNILAGTYARRYNAMQCSCDLEHCISMHELVDANAPTNHPMKYQFLLDYGGDLSLASTIIPDRATLEKGIALQKRGITLLPLSARMNLHIYLLNLAGALRTHYRHFAELSRLDELIGVLRDALKNAPQDQVVTQATLLHQLGEALSQRHQHCGEDNDLSNAISFLFQARSVVPLFHPAREFILTELTSCLVRRKPPDFDQAMSILDQELQKSEVNTPKLRVAYANLLQSRFLARKEHADIDKSIRLLQEVIKNTLDSDHIKPHYLRLLCKSLESQLRFTRRSAPPPSEWDPLISISQQIVDVTSREDPRRPMYLHDLGQYYTQVWLALVEPLEDQQIKVQCRDYPTVSTDHEAAKQALEAYRSAATAKIGPPSVQLHAAFAWANLSTLQGDIRSAFEGYTVALGMLPRIAWVGSGVARRYEELKRFPDVAREAAHTAIVLGEYEAAIEWLEASRSVVWGQILNLRTPLDGVRAVDRELGERLLSVSTALDSMSTKFELTVSNTVAGEQDVEGMIQMHHRLAEEWEVLVEKARSLPGLENFLRLRKLGQLVSAASNGPVVFLNCFELDCDALIVTKEYSSQGVMHVPLKGMDADKAGKLAESLQRALRDAHLLMRGSESDEKRSLVIGGPRNRNGYFNHLLATLWNDVVKPVIDALALGICEGNKVPPRIWWCPAGPLSFLPLHAAGLYHTKDPGTKVFEFVVSSYTPSLSILHERIHLSEPSDFQGLLAISQPNTPHLSPIPKTRDEVAQIVELMVAQEDSEHDLNIEWLDDAEATFSAVSSAMAAHSCIHLACHAVQYPSEPTKSTFKLADGDLTLLNIVSAHHPNAELAVLSACQTATGDGGLAEEAVHLASGMLVAGYRSVIATLWSIRDEDGPKIAKVVYEELLKRDSGWRGLRATGSAEALHRATAALRAKGNHFLSWVPFIHVGL